MTKEQILYEVLRLLKLTETKSKRIVARAWRRKDEKLLDCLLGIEFIWEDKKSSRDG